MMKEIILLFLLCYMASGKEISLGPPGKPTVTSCRSPEKETFTCWWKPGSDGGLPTTYALYYFRDNSETMHECPDYNTAGENSCFFNKNETSVWVNYNISVVATNKIGRTFSDSVDVDVAYIVQPHTPENVAVSLMKDKGWPFLRVSWESPHEADIRSGWITLIYELRSKVEGEEEWEEHYPGQQKTFNLYSVRSGSTYLVQVRCRPDHGFWSEWSTTTKVHVSEYLARERSLWILIVVFVSFVFLIVTWIIYMNSHSLKRCILPPIPGPKIKGLDHQLLKQNSRSKDGLSVLMIPDFPPTSSSNDIDFLVEYLEVFVPGEQELSVEEGKDLQDSYFKSESSDSDSGRGSCDSQTLLIDKCKEAKEDEQNADGENCGEIFEPQISQNNWDEQVLRCHNSPDTSTAQMKTWPSVFTSLPQYTTSPIQQKSSLQMNKHHCLSDTLFSAGSMSSNLSQLNSNQPIGPSYWKLGLNDMQPPQMHMQTCSQLQAHSDISIWKPVHDGLQPFRSIEYVEVQKVNKEDSVLLQPLKSSQSSSEGCPHKHRGEDYSKVKGVDSENMLLLESGMNVMAGGMDKCFCEEETNNVKECCHTESSSAAPLKHAIASLHTTTMPVQEPNVLATTGYIDTATMFTMPSVVRAE